MGEAGNGATFTITFATFVTDALNLKKTTMIAGRILLIDDDGDDCLFFCEALETVAPEIVCHTSSSGQYALRELSGQEIEMPDLIFLDVNMPVMSGWQCLCELKDGAYKHIPVIMHSNSSHREDIDKAHRFGAFCFFYKAQQFQRIKEKPGNRS